MWVGQNLRIAPNILHLYYKVVQGIGTAIKSSGFDFFYDAINFRHRNIKHEFAYLLK